MTLEDGEKRRNSAVLDAQAVRVLKSNIFSFELGDGFARRRLGIRSLTLLLPVCWGTPESSRFASGEFANTFSDSFNEKALGLGEPPPRCVHTRSMC